ncbi:MAG: type I glutamate--ammonia ligase, partial [Parasporobacterium sp.]|nr:type I glutamate--ammonia ligase [Parasporobacterium sp.]
LRSPDPCANPYLAYALLIYAGIDGIRNKLALPDPADLNLFTAGPEVLKQFDTLPSDLAEAKELAKQSPFIKEHISQAILDIYTR